MKNENTKQSKRLQGIVLKIVDDKTLKVRVETKYQHPLYRKIIKSHKNYLVNIGESKPEVNDLVWIEEGKPVSKNKSFYFVGKVK